MYSIELAPDFELTQEEIRQIIIQAKQAGEPLIIDIDIQGEQFFTDSGELASEFLYAAYIGESIAEACSEFECICGSNTVQFSVLPSDDELFISLLWNAIPGLMSEDLIEEEGIDEFDVAEIRSSGWDLLEGPQKAKYTGEVIEHARYLLAEGGKNEDGEDED